MQIHHSLAHKEHINRYKMAHMIGVAEYMRTNADAYNPESAKADAGQMADFRDQMYLIGLIHDVGYLRGRVGHEEFGAALIAKTLGEGTVSEMIREHGRDVSKVRMGILMNPVFGLLVVADYHIGIDGFQVTPDARVAEILTRFPNDAEVKSNLTHNLWYVKCVEAAMETKGITSSEAMDKAVSAFYRIISAEKSLLAGEPVSVTTDTSLPKLMSVEADLLSSLQAEHAKTSSEKVSEVEVADEVKEPNIVQAKEEGPKEKETAKESPSTPAAKAPARKAPETPREQVAVYRDTWRRIAEIYAETIDDCTPKQTVEKILQELPRENVVAAFAVVAALKDHDGRISGTPKTWAKEQFATLQAENPEAAKLAVTVSHANPMFEAGLDSIHPAHIYQLLGELRGIVREASAGKEQVERG